MSILSSAVPLILFCMRCCKRVSCASFCVYVSLRLRTSANKLKRISFAAYFVIRSWIADAASCNQPSSLIHATTCTAKQRHAAHEYSGDEGGRHRRVAAVCSTPVRLFLPVKSSDHNRSLFQPIQLIQDTVHRHKTNEMERILCLTFIFIFILKDKWLRT